MISQVVVGLVFSWFYLPNSGLFDQIVSLVGIDIPGGVFGNPDTATYGIIAAGLMAPDSLLHDPISNRVECGRS